MRTVILRSNMFLGRVVAYVHTGDGPDVKFLSVTLKSQKEAKAIRDAVRDTAVALGYEVVGKDR